MREQVGYCWQKAQEYAARAAEAPDKDESSYTRRWNAIPNAAATASAAAPQQQIFTPC
jgi:hypothetical protein